MWHGVSVAVPDLPRSELPGKGDGRDAAVESSTGMFQFSRLGSTIGITAHPSGGGFVSAVRVSCTFCDIREGTNVYKGDAGGAGGSVSGFSPAGKEESW
jgi:hypothetical protein